MKILELIGLSKKFHLKKKTVQAVRDISFTINEGETLTLVGESGSGKSTIGKMILRLILPTSGRVLFEGEDIFQIAEEDFRPFRKRMQMIFQDPYSSLNPYMTIKEILEEPLKIHNLFDNTIPDLLDLIHLPKSSLMQFPHQFSGGQRQRIGIARALVLKPKFLILDEPISSLDLSIQAQIINLLKDLQKNLKLTYLFISHDLSIVKHISSKVAIIFSGDLVEIGSKKEIFDNPLHPYTKELLRAAYALEIDGSIEHKSIQNEISCGCSFANRCPFRTNICFLQRPDLKIISEDHKVRCHLCEVH